jgi:hypothetical protein
VYLCYTRFINTMKQEPVIEQLLPLSAIAAAVGQGREVGLRLGLHLRARRATVIDELLVRYVEALVYQAVAENMAVRAERAHGGHEGRHRQRRQRDRRAQAGLQQDPPGGDHQGTVGNRGGAAAV